MGRRRHRGRKPLPVGSAVDLPTPGGTLGTGSLPSNPPSPRTTGTVSTTAASSATSARAPASCARASAASASCARARATQIVLTTYGRSSGFCVDPIEKKPLNHFLPGTSVLSFGTAGCNLACRFCQNWDISKSREIDTLADAASPETIAARRARARLPERRLHLQRPGRSSSSTRSTSPTPAASAASEDGRGDRRLHLRRAARASFYRAHGRRERRPQGLHRGLLPPGLRRRTSRRCSRRSSTSARDRRLVRDHDAADPRARTTRDAELDAHEPLGGRAPRARRAAALHGVPPRLPDARHAADAAGDAHARAARSRARTASATSTRATCTTPTGASTCCHGCGAPRDRARLVRARRLRTSTTTGAAARCGTPLPGRFAGPPAPGARGGCPVRLADFEATT